MRKGTRGKGEGTREKGRGKREEVRGTREEVRGNREEGKGKSEEWWLGAITNWEAREIEIPTDFLGSGEWKVEAFEDAPDADTNAEHHVRREFTIKAGEKINVRLAPGGGYAARFEPKLR